MDRKQDEFGDKVIDLFMPTKKEITKASQRVVAQTGGRSFTRLIDAIACIHYFH